MVQWGFSLYPVILFLCKITMVALVMMQSCTVLKSYIIIYVRSQITQGTNNVETCTSNVIVRQLCSK